MNGLPPVKERLTVVIAAKQPKPGFIRCQTTLSYALVCFQAGMYMLKLPCLPGGKPCPPRPCAQGPRPVSGAMRLWRLVSRSGCLFFNQSIFTMNKIINRMQGNTPKFFKTLRNIGVAMLAVSAAVFELPVELPTIITDVAGYLTVAGAVMGAVSQSAVLNEQE